MAQQTTYTVDYIINVVNANGVKTIADWQAALNKLGGSIKMLDRLNKRITTLNKAFHNKSWKLTLNTADAERKISSLETRVAALRKSLAGMTGGAGGRGGRGGGIPAAGAAPRQFIKYGGSLYSRGQQMPSNKTLGKGYQWSKSSIPIQAFNTKELAAYNKLMEQQTRLTKSLRRAQAAGQTGTAKYRRQQSQLGRVNNNIGRMTTGYVASHSNSNVPAPFMGRGGRGGGSMGGGTVRPTPNNLGYKLFGPTPLTSNGGMAIDMLKGMGIAYGIAGIGSFFSNIIQSSADYDNTMQTVENILKSNDKQGNFDSRFNAMSKTIRQVGIQTKFKVTEVADAAKFLAMAGLDVGEITEAIAPIANIALVGDTDLGETADLVTNVMTAYNMKAYQMRQASDIMTKTFTKTNTTLPEIAESFKYSASLLSAGGIGFEEATGAIGVLGNAGIKGSQAGTTMRTILNNIINPRGKYRKQAWADTGVATTDKNGKIRPLLDIFNDLANKGLPVDAFYKLFDKTAAQGAVALATHIEDWNDVVKENFLSTGIAQELADKKKDTISGLWAQLTSSITDDGVTAFKGVENDIKSILISTTHWIQQESTKDLMSGLFRDFMNFMGLIKDSLSWFYKFYSVFKGPIRLMVEWQLRLWPIIKLLQTLKTTFLALMGVTRLAAGIRALALSFRALSGALGGPVAASRFALADLGRYIATGGTMGGKMNWMAPMGGMPLGKNGEPTSQVIGTYQGRQVVQNSDGSIVLGGQTSSIPKKMSKWAKFGRGAGIAGAIAAPIAGYAIGNAIAPESGGGLWGGMAGAAVGAWGMTGFAGAGAAASFLFTNPIGWGILAVAAIAAVRVYAYKTAKAIHKANECTSEWAASIAKLGIDGIDWMKDSAIIDANLRVTTSGLLSMNDQLRAGINNWEQWWIARNGPDEKNDPSQFKPSETTWGLKMDQLLEDADRSWGRDQLWRDRFSSLHSSNPYYGVNGNTFYVPGMSYTTLGKVTQNDAVILGLMLRGAERGTNKNSADYNPFYAAAVETIPEKFWSLQNHGQWAETLNAIIASIVPDQNSEYNYIDFDTTQKIKGNMMAVGSVPSYRTPTIASIRDYASGFNDILVVMNAVESGRTANFATMNQGLFKLFNPFFGTAFGTYGTDQWKQNMVDYMHTADGRVDQRHLDELLFVWQQLNKFYDLLPTQNKGILAPFLDRGLMEAILPKGTKFDGGIANGSTLAAGQYGYNSANERFVWKQYTDVYGRKVGGWFRKNSDGSVSKTPYYGTDITARVGNNGITPVSFSGKVFDPVAHAPAPITVLPYTWGDNGLVPNQNHPLFVKLPMPWDSSTNVWKGIPYASPAQSAYTGYTSFVPNINTNGYATSNMLSQAQPKFQVSGGVFHFDRLADHITLENHDETMNANQFESWLTSRLRGAANAGTGVFNYKLT